MENIEVMTPMKKALLEKNMKSASYRKKHARENKNLKIMCSILLLSNFILLALLFA
jgi:heme/copper-type cytochrome/quinol oxidase subunit 3